MTRRRAGWRYRGTKRITVVPHILRANVNVVQFFRAIIDGPGGVLIRDAVSWTYGWLGHATVNSRTGRGTVNTSGVGSVSGPVHSTQAERRRRRASERRSR